MASNPTVPPTDAYVSITSFGAVGDGVTNNQTAIQNALNYAAANNVAVYIPAGNYAYSGTLTADGVAVYGAGTSSVLTALDGSNEALTLTGNGASVSDLQIDGAGTTRLSTPWSCLIWADVATNYTVDNVLLNGSSSCGIMNYGSTGGLIENNTVENTLADSITSINGSTNIAIQGNLVENSGDDGISVVSYTDEPIDNYITIEGNTVLNNMSGRGISVVGGNNVTITGNNVQGGPAGVANIYIAAESQWGTVGVNDVLVSGNTLINGGGLPSGTGQGAITINNTQGTAYNVTNITITGNQIVNPLNNAIQFVGNGNSSGVFENNTVYSNNPPSWMSNSGDPASSFTETNNQVLALSQYTTPLVAAGGGVTAVSTPTPTPTPTAQPSPNGTMITSASASLIIDEAGNAWSLVQSASQGLQIAVNGTVDPSTNNVVLLENLGGNMVQENTSGNWYSEPGPNGPWTLVSPPAIDVTTANTRRTTVVNAATPGTKSAVGSTFELTAPGVAQVTLGSKAETLKFLMLSHVTLTGGSAAATIIADGGTNTFTGGKGALNITGGNGADAYVYHQGDARMTIQDFSFAKGDTLTVDKTLLGSMSETSDGSGGMLVSFGSSSPGVDLVGVTSITSSQIHIA